MSASVLFTKVTKTYRAGIPGCWAEAHALRGIDLEVVEGELIAVLGACGAGKSTLLLCAAGLLRPDGGSILWSGSRNAPPSSVAYVTARATAYSFLTVREALEYDVSRRRRGAPALARGVSDAMERVSLGEYASTRIANLPRGMHQRLTLAQALIASPRLLLLDDVLVGSDPVTRRELRSAVRELHSQRVTIVIASNRGHEVAGLATRAVTLHEGRVLDSIQGSSGWLSRSLELSVEAPAAAAALLRHHHPDITYGALGLTVPLGGESPEAVLARCQALRIAVLASRVQMSEPLPRLTVP